MSNRLLHSPRLDYDQVIKLLDHGRVPCVCRKTIPDTKVIYEKTRNRGTTENRVERRNERSIPIELDDKTNNRNTLLYARLTTIEILSVPIKVFAYFPHTLYSLLYTKLKRILHDDSWSNQFNAIYGTCKETEMGLDRQMNRYTEKLNAKLFPMDAVRDKDNTNVDELILRMGCRYCRICFSFCLTYSTPHCGPMKSVRCLLRGAAF
ncbi:hypothetical protein KQX54_019763 [Cotesia glomerata]|uniref:Uncharacterized protein n=1 Tax=Cotesia glomerata TaxID=32391 RepID=A0AAV7I163_COTGL|nr:hypothetical protein KQX54_019763 [Cotesia glomerata]